MIGCREVENGPMNQRIGKTLVYSIATAFATKLLQQRIIFSWKKQETEI